MFYVQLYPTGREKLGVRPAAGPGAGDAACRACRGRPWASPVPGGEPTHHTWDSPVHKGWPSTKKSCRHSNWRGVDSTRLSTLKLSRLNSVPLKQTKPGVVRCCCVLGPSRIMRLGALYRRSSASNLRERAGRLKLLAQRAAEGQRHKARSRVTRAVVAAANVLSADPDRWHGRLAGKAAECSPLRIALRPRIVEAHDRRVCASLSNQLERLLARWTRLPGEQDQRCRRSECLDVCSDHIAIIVARNRCRGGGKRG